ncbi:hypothetical protein RN001_009746 [Aquatica leii]|uniref:Uncharacterized protein n=1 Tax=Aquatica leii TaxID=1421715 RepID=A0AAN7NZZ5_9COLE|nr:hypothetical protein RN001_009746 [Aquatica leii]
MLIQPVQCIQTKLQIHDTTSVSPLMPMDTQGTTNQNNAGSSSEPLSPMESSTVSTKGKSELFIQPPFALCHVYKKKLAS